MNIFLILKYLNLIVNDEDQKKVFVFNSYYTFLLCLQTRRLTKGAWQDTLPCKMQAFRQLVSGKHFDRNRQQILGGSFSPKTCCVTAHICTQSNQPDFHAHSRVRQLLVEYVGKEEIVDTGQRMQLT